MPLKLTAFESGQLAALNRWADFIETQQKGITSSVQFTNNTANQAITSILTLQINGGGTGSTTFNFNSTNPAIPSTDAPVVWQQSTSGSTTNITAYVAPFGASGASHAPGAVPDPGSTAGSLRFLNEDATWLDAVTSIALTVPSWLTVTGSPITTSGTLAITGTSESPNLIVASPNGSAGAVSPRAMVAADEPSTTVNSVTNDTNVTGSISAQDLVLGWTGTLAVARGGTGTSTPGLVAGTNITITGTWPDQTINATGTSGGGTSVKTSTYAVVSGDSGTLLVANSASALTFTLLATPPSSTFYVRMYNESTGVLTVSPNGLTIDGRSASLTLSQGDAVVIYTDGTNYFTGSPRPASLMVFMPGTGTANQVLLYAKMDRAIIFPASAPNAYGVALTAATASTTYTYKKNGTSFATAVFAASGTTATWTQASDESFAPADILEISGPATADATLANMGLTLQGFRY